VKWFRQGIRVLEMHTGDCYTTPLTSNKLQINCKQQLRFSSISC